MKRESKRAYFITPHRAYPQTKLKIISQFYICQDIECKKYSRIIPNLNIVNINAYAQFWPKAI